MVPWAGFMPSDEGSLLVLRPLGLSDGIDRSECEAASLARGVLACTGRVETGLTCFGKAGPRTREGVDYNIPLSLGC